MGFWMNIGDSDELLPFPINPAPVHGNIFPANTGVYATQTGFNTYGNQASYLLEEEDETQMGLLITFARSEKRGSDGNGVLVTVRDTTSNTVDYDADARTLDITVTNANQNLSTIKTIDRRAHRIRRSPPPISARRPATTWRPCRAGTSTAAARTPGASCS